jgi:hypothetical protein
MRVYIYDIEKNVIRNYLLKWIRVDRNFLLVGEFMDGVCENDEFPLEICVILSPMRSFIILFPTNPVWENLIPELSGYLPLFPEVSASRSLGGSFIIQAWLKLFE